MRAVKSPMKSGFYEELTLTLEAFKLAFKLMMLGT
jgi:hypothetical protein